MIKTQHWLHEERDNDVMIQLELLILEPRTMLVLGSFSHLILLVLLER